MELQNIGETAKVYGLYRCTNLGETVFVKPGEQFPKCSCDPPGQWELRKEDNIERNDAIIIFVAKGLIHAIQTDELPEIGQLLNLRQSMGMEHLTGLFKIVEIDENFECMGEKSIWINVERIGSFANDLPIHIVGIQSC